LPSELGYVDTDGEALTVAVMGEYAFLADGPDGVRVIDINPPGSAHEVGFYEPPLGWVDAVEVKGSYLIVANGYQGLKTLNITDPTTPTLAGSIVGGWTNALDLDVEGDYVYLADKEMGVKAYYIADPASPLPAGAIDNGGWSEGIVAVGTRVYLAEQHIGVSVMDFSPPPTATTVAAFDAHAVGTGVELRWEVESDDGITGYCIHRSVVGSATLPANPGGVIGPDASGYTDTGVEPGNTYRYTLEVLLEDGSGVLSPEIEIAVGAVPLALQQNIPNPFNPTTTISFSIPSSQHVMLSVFDVTGRLVQTIVDGRLDAGLKQYRWDGTDADGNHVHSGVYFCRLTVGKGTLTRKMVLVR
jgi:hypothetical protein